ncbi:quinone oxidoreductase family protein [Paraburkholderia rhynchosiae]|uniref:Quinone oxidoreductase n=1 Tax=Paraburkholderia rhynchosiae TaxID=487049 RepID=A0A2N7WHA5_9BURK|nr:quinone oxidoreductase [Paraburkholderia rhynchosiae]PMS28797.1 quinone oxidoreductase [Paraburkholderia rhynchosiae]CAB3656390.1 Quinone oxidoreductase 1 [Paraburkholderia rhynchosiae]
MITAIRITDTGSPDVMTVSTGEKTDPAAGQVWLEQDAIGVNYLDVTQRNGAVRIPLPSGLGLEGAGRVVAVGAGVDNVKVGERVAYATGPIGAYTSARLFPADRLVPLPDDVSCEDAAAVLFKGITAQYLLKSTFPVTRGTTVLLYGVAGGVGQIMASWAKALGATVIGVVSKAASVQVAKNVGCDDVIVFNPATLANEVAKATEGRKVDVVYDPIGRISFDASLNSLRPRGLLVSFGASSGAPGPVDVSTLNAKGSLFLTRPSIVAHTSTAAEYQKRARDVLSALAAGTISARIWRTYALADAATAHADLETGASAGAIILKP